MEDLFGNNLADNLTEGVAADNILDAGGNDTLNEGGGNDSSYGDSGKESLNSGAGEDFVDSGSGNDAFNPLLEADIDNGIGDDVYIGSGKDTLDTLEGGIDNGIDDEVNILTDLFGDNFANNLTGGGGADNIFGAGGNDILNGAGGNDNIFGDSGNDSLYAGAGVDFLYGGEGNDTLNALDLGQDNLFGGIGDDVYIVNWTLDNLVEGPNQGIDLVQSVVTYDALDANVENLLLTGVSNINGTGNNLNNQIRGNSANNTLSGLGGNDTLNGGGGTDILTGGLGSNQFLFDTALVTAGLDIITDFSIFLNDKIVLDKTVFSTLETFVGVLLDTDYAVIDVPLPIEVLVAGNNVDEIVYNRQTGNLLYNPNNNVEGLGVGGGRFATIAGSPDNLSNFDFRVVL